VAGLSGAALATCGAVGSGAASGAAGVGLGRAAAAAVERAGALLGGGFCGGVGAAGSCANIASTASRSPATTGGGAAVAGVGARRPSIGAGAGVRAGTGLKCAVSTGASGLGALSVAHTEHDATAASSTPTRMRRAIATHGDVREAERAYCIGSGSKRWCAR